MKPYLIRSTLFNIAFFGVTALLCVLYLPLLLLPRQWYIDAVHFWLYIISFLERHIMGITFEIRGAENIPEKGPYLIAAKHQSAYETMKLHLLFDDPAIILKKELLNIPLWGFFLRKADVIAIDRSTPEKALKSIEDGARRVTAQGRPIVIFPQGTRVSHLTTAQEKPYKPGIARVQEVTDLPVIPMALNSGFFWPRNSWLKRPGKVIFEFMEPIPAGKNNRKELLQKIEMSVEEATHRLINEAEKEAQTHKPNPLPQIITAALCVLVFTLYSILWITASNEVRTAYKDFLSSVSGEERAYLEPEISGFPGPVKAYVAREYLNTEAGSVRVENLKAKSWPIIGAPIYFSADSLEIKSIKWPNSLTFTGFKAKITTDGRLIDIHSSEIHKDDFTMQVEGTIDTAQRPFPGFDIEVAMTGHAGLLADLVEAGIMETRPALFTAAGLSALSDKDGFVRVPLTQRNRKLYAGPLPVASLPALPPRAPRNQPAPDR